MFSIRATKFIQEICKPLQGIALTNFMHDITFEQGQISMLVNSKDVFQFYYNNRVPTLCTDETGRTLAAGVYVNKTLENSRRDCAILMPLLVKIGRRFGQNYGKNSIHIVERENDCQHLYSLFFDLEENDFLQWILNNGNFLKDFISAYNVRASDVILEAKASENRIVLPTFSYFAQAMKLDVTDQPPQLSLFHKHLHMPVYLTKQQSKCLLLLMAGKTAKMIGLQLQISHRTVEHYFEDIRHQFMRVAAAAARQIGHEFRS